MVSGFLNKRSHSTGRQGCKISLAPKYCKLIGLVVQSAKKMDWNFRIPEEDKMGMQLPPKKFGIAWCWYHRGVTSKTLLVRKWIRRMLIGELNQVPPLNKNLPKTLSMLAMEKMVCVLTQTNLII